MTPAILFLEKHRIVFETLEYSHDAANQNFSNEASVNLKLPPELVYKTLVIEVDLNHFVLAIIPSNTQLSMKKMAKAASGKKAAMAQAKKVQTMSGYVLGGVSPFGQKKTLDTFVDLSAQSVEKLYVSGGRRGLEIGISPIAFKSLKKIEFIALTA
jgi:Cys-tRNA(Pro)/Cys-tRNA(Cys) deacylase